jgi:peptide chain release factor 1
VSKELLFSVTSADCRFDYFRGSGKGGQKRNKTSSGVRCTHKDSGAVGVSDDTRSQHDNKKIAFQRMAESDRFKTWHKIEVARRSGRLAQASDYAEQEIKSKRTVVEVQRNGKWVNESETND